MKIDLKDAEPLEVDKTKSVKKEKSFKANKYRKAFIKRMLLKAGTSEESVKTESDWSLQ